MLREFATVLPVKLKLSLMEKLKLHFIGPAFAFSCYDFIDSAIIQVLGIIIFYLLLGEYKIIFILLQLFHMQTPKRQSKISINLCKNLLLNNQSNQPKTYFNIGGFSPNLQLKNTQSSTTNQHQSPMAVSIVQLKPTRMSQKLQNRGSYIRINPHYNVNGSANYGYMRGHGHITVTNHQIANNYRYEGNAAGKIGIATQSTPTSINHSNYSSYQPRGAIGIVPTQQWSPLRPSQLFKSPSIPANNTNVNINISINSNRMSASVVKTNLDSSYGFDQSRRRASRSESKRNKYITVVSRMPVSKKRSSLQIA